ncbi:Type VI secretion lipoprotein [compost metagenome]
MPTQIKRLSAVAMLLVLAGCGVTDRIGKRMDDTWAADMLADSEKVILTADGGNQLNPDASGTPLSVVMRVYQLTSLERFTSTDADSLWDDPKKALGNTLVESREITLLPGIGQIDQWPLSPSARYVGVAAFFRVDDNGRWKVASQGRHLVLLRRFAGAGGQNRYHRPARRRCSQQAALRRTAGRRPPAGRRACAEQHHRQG